MDYSCPYCRKSLEGKGDSLINWLRTDKKQVTCIYCLKTIQVQSYYGYDFASKALLFPPVLLFIKLILSDKNITWYWWTGNAALAAVCYLVWRPIHLKHKNAKFYEEPRFNRPIPKQRRTEK